MSELRGGQESSRAAGRALSGKVPPTRLVGTSTAIFMQKEKKSYRGPTSPAEETGRENKDPTVRAVSGGQRNRKAGDSRWEPLVKDVNV